MPRIALSMLFLALTLCGSHTSYAREIYTYKDESGRTHYTDTYSSIPPRYRDSIQELDPNREGTRSIGIVPMPGTAKSAEAPAAKPTESENVFEAFRRGAASGEHGFSALHIGLAVLFGLVFLAIGLSLSSLVLMIACAIASQPSIEFGKGVLVSVVMSLANAVVGFAMQVVGGNTVGASAPILWIVFAFGAGIAANALVLRGMHCETAGGSFKVALLYTFIPVLVGISIGLLALFLGALGS